MTTSSTSKKQRKSSEIKQAAVKKPEKSAPLDAPEDAPVYLLSSSTRATGNTDIKKAFARKLLQAMLHKSMSQSDLARMVFGAGKDTRGFNVAKGRDRISNYIGGKSLPNQHTLQKIAQALEVKWESLLPHPSIKGVGGMEEVFLIRMLAAYPDKVLVHIQLPVSFAVATEISALIRRDREATAAKEQPLMPPLAEDEDS